ncbi:MAG: signal recognition particle-docking protein FtsY [Cellvibrionaceae bacterium]
MVFWRKKKAAKADIEQEGKIQQSSVESPDKKNVVDTVEEPIETDIESVKADTEKSLDTEATVHVDTEQAPEEKKKSIFSRIKQGLSRTSSQFSDGIGSLLFGKKEIDDELLEEIETQLLMADVGIETTTKIIDELTKKVERKQLADGDALFVALQESLKELLKKVEAPLVIDAVKKPFVLLVVGVNGVGKTTTIGKLAKRFQNEGHSVMLAAGDTFRAAAVEQLKVWGDRNDVTVVAQATGSDSASVIYDAVESAKAKNIDIIIADTAGRLQNKSHLMDELSKVKRVVSKLDASAPHEILLVLDAGTGQNALSQAEHFSKAVDVSGIALTKLDGTAKGGIIFALSDKFGLPVRYIGVGEGIDDLQPFKADTFVEALFGQDNQ